jgi:hypothetical protein
MIYGGIVWQEAKTEIERLDAQNSKMAVDTLGKDSTEDWWSYTTRGYAPMKELIRNGHATLLSIISQNVTCSTRIWSIDQLNVLFYRFPPAVQKLFSIAYELFLFLSALIIAFGCYIAIRMRDKNTIILFVLTLGIIVAGTFANMCTAYGRMNIPLIPFLLIALGLGIEAVLEYFKKTNSEL